MTPTFTTTIAVIGGGVVGAAILHTLSHRGVDVLLLEAEGDLAYAASGTNSGVLHTGFDSTPGTLETQLILRSAALRPSVLESLSVPLLAVGAELIPRSPSDIDTVGDLVANAAQNGVEVRIREADGALLVPGESVTDPVSFTLALAEAAQLVGGRVFTDSKVVEIVQDPGSLTLRLADGRTVVCQVAINAAGLHADEVAALVGDESFEIYPRKGEFFVYELPEGQKLEHIVLPVPTKRTKGVLVFPTLDGRVVAGPTAIDLLDKDDWSVRANARDEILEKAAEQFPALKGLEPIASYAGLRPAGRDVNYVIGSSTACDRLINVAAIRSTGLSASLGIAAYVSELLPNLGVELGEQQPLTRLPARAAPALWWQRTSRYRATR